MRTYYRGVRGFVGDEKRGDLRAGQWTHRTQLALLVADELAARGAGRVGPRIAEDFWRRVRPGAVLPEGSAPAATAPIAVWAASRILPPEELLRVVQERLTPRYPGPDAIAAAYGQSTALVTLLTRSAQALERDDFFSAVAEATAWAEGRLSASDRCSRRLARLRGMLDAFPLDLQECCDGTGHAADEAWPFAVAMFARRPHLVEATLLSAVNVGGDAPTVGACVGSLLGALHGLAALPAALITEVEGQDRLDAAVERLVG